MLFSMHFNDPSVQTAGQTLVNQSHTTIWQRVKALFTNSVSKDRDGMKRLIGGLRSMARGCAEDAANKTGESLSPRALCAQ